jgi:hypothetical protein
MNRLFEQLSDEVYDQFKKLVREQCDPQPPVDVILVYFLFERGLRTFLYDEPSFLHPLTANIDDERDTLRVGCIFTPAEFEYQQQLRNRYKFPPIPWPSTSFLF